MLGTQPPPNTDIRLYSGGNLYAAAFGQAGSTKVAELRIKYRFAVELPTLLNIDTDTSPIPGGVFLCSTQFGGEPTGATGVLATNFLAANDPAIAINGIGAALSSTGVITLNSGIYQIEYGFNSWGTAVSVTGGVVTLSTQTAGGNVYGTTNGAQAANVGVLGYKPWSNTASWVWDTTTMGKLLSLASTVTYASGSAFVSGYIKITAV
jgi:hypothetical protein